jgi:hypothetical protein
MIRIVTVTKMGKDAPSDSKGYRVVVTGQDKRIFEVWVPLTVVASKPAMEKEIATLFAQGWLPQNGAVHMLSGTGW